MIFLLQDDEGYNPFLCAGRGGYLDVVKLLAEDDRTDVNVQVCTYGIFNEYLSLSHNPALVSSRF